MALARAKNLPHAAYFLDVKAAYYRVIRASLSFLGHTDTALRSVLSQLKVPPAFLHDVMACATGAKLLDQLSPHLQAFVDQTLRGTHFRMDGCDYLTHTRAGVRPGDAIADILFAFVQADFLQALQERLTEEGFFEDDVLHGSPLAGRLISPTWADDTVPLFSAPSCARLLEKTTQLGAVMHELLHTRGLCPKYEKGKTEVVAMLTGPGALSSKHRLFVMDGGYVSFSARTGRVHVRCVPTYTHLGGRVQCRGGVLADILQKSATAFAAIRPLQRSVLQSPLIPLPEQRQILVSLGISRLAFSAPTWGLLNHSESEAWRKAWTRLCRALTQDDRWTGTPTFPDTAAVCTAVGMPAPAPFLRGERLHHFVRLVVSLQETLLALLRLEYAASEQSWLACLQSDLRWASALVDFPASIHEDFPDGLIQCCLDTPSRIHRLIKAAVALAPHEALLTSPEAATGLFVRDRCNQHFSSYWHKLALHRFSTHGLRAEADSFASGVTCPACLKRHWTRSRLLRHLQYGSTPCLRVLSAHAMHVPPLYAAEREGLAQQA